MPDQHQVKATSSSQWHEVMDRVHVMLATLTEHVGNHAAGAGDDEFGAAIANAEDRLAELYSLAARRHIESKATTDA